MSQSARDALKETLIIIEGFLSNSKWIAGDNLTIADFSSVAIISTITECGYDLSQHANISRWYEQCQSLPGFEANLEGAKGLAERLKSKVEGTVF